MEIKEVKKLRDEAEDEIKIYVAGVLERFVKQTGVPVEAIYIHMSTHPTAIAGHQTLTVEGVTLQPDWDRD